MLLKLEPSTHLLRTKGPFRIRRIRPGAALGDPADSGLGGLGLVDRAHLAPGLTVPMHQHRNDEIISYLRDGLMIHRDSAGLTEEVRPDRVMIMNAGSGMSHEETVPGPGDVHMLQVFIRPEREELEPAVQFHDLASVHSMSAWRLIAGPAGSPAPGWVRQRVSMSDARLPAGESLAVPSLPGHDAWLYVFAGDVTVGDIRLTENDALIVVDEGPLTVAANIASDLVLFLVDRAAPASRLGTLSGGR